MTNLAVPASTASVSAAASTTAGTGATTSGTTGSAGSAAALTQTDFIQLLTAQLKYQSPTNPADPTQLASEFAQISTVNGINQLNTTVSGIETGGAASQLAQASSLVGKQVTVAGNDLIPNSAGVATGAFSLASAAQNATVTILSPSGIVAGTKQLGPLAAGQNSFTWGNGTAGTHYTYQVTANGTSGAAVSVTPSTVYTVDGVNVSDGTQTFSVQGTSTAVPVSSIQSVLGGTTS
ncbi:flagellar hook assembly protein FlgD [Acidisoma sp.]|uniref:flagellar hook assembly protein FlgD n=1 Tax=Acidisoma sp. TaxID=1872115 RepID=UPI003AFFA1A6